MTRKLAHLVPSFLKQIDRHFLLNHPALWVTKIHFVLFYGLLAAMAIGVFSLIPLSPYSLPDVEVHFVIAILPAMVGLMYWAWHVGRINVERYFGTTSLRQRIGLQAIYLLCIGVFVSIPFLYGQSVAYRAANSLSDERLKEHAQAFFLVQDYVDYFQSTDYHMWLDDEQLTSPKQRAEARKEITGAANRNLALRNYSALIQLYTEKSLTPEAEGEIAYAFHNGSTAENLYSVDKELIYETQEDLERLIEAKTDWSDQSLDFQVAIPNAKNFNQHDGFPPTAIFLIGFYLLIFLMLYKRLGNRQFFLSLIVGTATILLAGLTFALVEAAVDLRGEAEEAFVGLLYFGGAALLAIPAFLLKQNKKTAFWRRASLMIIAVASPLALLFAYMSADALNGDITPTYIFGVGMAFAIVLWNAVFEPRLLAMQAEPSGD